MQTPIQLRQFKIILCALCSRPTWYSLKPSIYHWSPPSYKWGNRSLCVCYQERPYLKPNWAQSPNSESRLACFAWWILGCIIKAFITATELFILWRRERTNELPYFKWRALLFPFRCDCLNSSMQTGCLWEKNVHCVLLLFSVVLQIPLWLTTIDWQIL